MPRWISDNPNPAPRLAHTIIAGWRPTTYYMVGTIEYLGATGTDGLKPLIRSLPSPSPRPRRNRSRNHLRTPRRKHKPAPRSVGRTGYRRPDQATIPSLRRYSSSGRSDTAPSPNHRTKPRSIPNKARTPSGHCDTEPSPGPFPLAATPDRNRELPTRFRGCRDLRLLRSSRWCVGAMPHGG